MLLCSWDGVSRACDVHRYPAAWSRDAAAEAFDGSHPLAVAPPCRREVLTGLSSESVLRVWWG